MNQLNVNRHVAAPIEVVFAQSTDFPHAADFINGISKVDMLTDGPVGEGTRFRETRVMFGREATEEMQVVRYERPGAYALAAESHGARYLSTFTFTEKDGGTDVEMVFVATPVTFTAKLMAVAMKPMIKKVMAMCAKDLDDLAVAAERRVTASITEV